MLLHLLGTVLLRSCLILGGVALTPLAALAGIQNVNTHVNISTHVRAATLRPVSQPASHMRASASTLRPVSSGVGVNLVVLGNGVERLLLRKGAGQLNLACMATRASELGATQRTRASCGQMRGKMSTPSTPSCYLTASSWWRWMTRCLGTRTARYRLIYVNFHLLVFCAPACARS